MLFWSINLAKLYLLKITINYRLPNERLYGGVIFRNNEYRKEQTKFPFTNFLK